LRQHFESQKRQFSACETAARRHAFAVYATGFQQAKRTLEKAHFGIRQTRFGQPFSDITRKSPAHAHAMAYKS